MPGYRYGGKVFDAQRKTPVPSVVKNGVRPGRPVKPKPDCGSDEAVYWHRRYNVPLDEACKITERRLAAARLKRKKENA